MQIKSARQPRMGLTLVALAVALWVSRSDAAGDAARDDGDALATRLAAAGKSLFAAAHAGDLKSVLVLTRVDPASSPDRRLLLDAIDAGLVRAVQTQGLTCVAPADAERAAAELAPAGKKSAPPRPADVTSLRKSVPCDAVLFAVYSRSGDRRTLRLSLLDEQRSLGTTSVALAKKDVAGVLATPLGREEVDRAQARVGAELKRAAGPLVATAGEKGLKSTAVIVLPDREGAAESEKLAFVVRAELEKVLPGATGKAAADPAFHLAPEAARALAAGRKPGPLGPKDVSRLKSATAAAGVRATDALLAVVCSRRGGKNTVEFTLFDAEHTAGKASATLDEWDLATIPEVPLLNRSVLAFAAERIGEQVGNGECWTLADDALKAAGARPAIGYTFGKELRPGEPALPGDILQFTSVKLAGRGYTMTLGTPNHTAIIREVKSPKSFEVLHQNFGAPGKTVSKATVNLADLTEGDVKIFRPVRG